MLQMFYFYFLNIFINTRLHLRKHHIIIILQYKLLFLYYLQHYNFFLQIMSKKNYG